MSFTGGKILSSEVPGKLYSHSSLVLDNPQEGYSVFNHVYQIQLTDVMENILKKIKDLDYYIMVSWMDDSKIPLFDLSVYSLGPDKIWKSNSEEKSWIIKKGVWYRPVGEESNTCSEGKILFGEEEKLRRKLPKESYLKTILNVRELNEMLKFK